MGEPSRWFGPDRIPLATTAAATEAHHGYRPFHGIVSLGLRAHPACTPEGWHALAPRLDFDSDMGSALAEAARGCGVLSFDDSLAAAEHAARGYAQGARLTELWHLKEGHTASVWCASFNQGRDTGLRRIVFNVGRDDAASVALEHATKRFRVIAEREPDLAAARVLGLWHLNSRNARSTSIVVVAQAFVDNALEIHAVPTTNGGRQLVAVERFLTDPDQPARIRAVCGRPLDRDEHARFGADIAVLLASGAHRDPEQGAWILPTFVLNHGDWVWRGDRAVAVACGPDPTVVAVDSLREAVHMTLRTACDALGRDYVRAISDSADAALDGCGATS